MKPDLELPVIRACHEFIVWLLPKVGKFPRDLRFTLGEKIEQRALSVLELLIRARYQADRAALLDAANVDLEILRFLLRMAHDLKALPTKVYGQSSGKMLQIGQQIGGWKKSTGRRNPP